MGGVRVTPSHHFYLGFLFYVCFFIRMNNFQVFFSKTIKKLFFYETCIVLCFVSIYRCALTVGITCCAPYVLLCFFLSFFLSFLKKKKELASLIPDARDRQALSETSGKRSPEIARPSGKKKKGENRESNPGPLPPKGRIIPLDHFRIVKRG